MGSKLILSASKVLISMFSDSDSLPDLDIQMNDYIIVDERIDADDEVIWLQNPATHQPKPFVIECIVIDDEN